jgi:hypothetical protein
MIDVIEIIGCLLMRGSIYTLWWDMLAGNLDNSRALFLFFDLIMTKIGSMVNERKTTTHHSGPRSSGGAFAKEVESLGISL